MTMISRDGFARQELHRRVVTAPRQSCSFCGGSRWRGGKPTERLFQYRTETDGGRSHNHGGLFCSLSCHDSYHDQPRRRSRMNAERLRELADRVEAATPESLDMNLIVHDCGTPSCIGGHLIAMVNPQELRGADLHDLRSVGQEVLGLSPLQGDALFTPRGYELDLSEEQRARVHKAAVSLLRGMADGTRTLTRGWMQEALS